MSHCKRYSNKLSHSFSSLGYVQLHFASIIDTSTASFPFHYIYHAFHPQRCNTFVSAKQSINISHVQELLFSFIAFKKCFIKGATHSFQRNNQSSTLKHVWWVVKFHFTSVVVECSERWWEMKTMLKGQVYFPIRNIVALTFIISGCSGENN